VKKPSSTDADSREDLATATAKVRMWEGRAVQARLEGRLADAQRCDDKARDWASKVRQIERADSSQI
jgi:hypothetical protein